MTVVMYFIIYPFNNDLRVIGMVTNTGQGLSQSETLNWPI